MADCVPRTLLSPELQKQMRDLQIQKMDLAGDVASLSTQLAACKKSEMHSTRCFGACRVAGSETRNRGQG